MKNKIFYLLIFTNLFAANEGIEVGKNLKGHFSNVQTNVVAPLTSNSDFKTVNGSKSFKANLTCNETVKPFLEISYSGTSDITINVSIDTDFNGSKDKIFSFDGVSGVGTNGIIKCSTNTWKNCKYFLWNISNNNLTLSETVLTNLGGPYCINSSCGSLSVNQKINVLDTIGGAISSMYQSSNSNYLITKTQNDGNKIIFYGQNYQDCTNYKEQAPSKSHDLDTTNVIASQSKDENSVYYVLNEEVKNQNTNKFDTDVKQTTVIKNSVTVKGDTSDYTFTYSGKTQNEDGSWSTRNDNAKVNIDFLNPNIKYCEIKYLEENSILFSDGQTHHSSSGDTKTWKTKIVECTGNDYSICPVDTSKGEIIKHPCGQIDNFAEATSILMAIDEAVDDFSCSLK
ncbi:hypothetical protein ACOL3G_04865 [Aliarcobacter butzleri]|uniref:hypothetical protein n=1 Tax=Aliarcobacter butzleri TaxID=28197 RepID=UPI0012607708|nr:hypothetical protein [Aliarcobacter butzleri]